MSRRARKYHPRPVYANAVEIAIGRARPISAADVAMHASIMQTALGEFRQGKQCSAHWLALADASNMAETLCDMGLGGGDDVRHIVQQAQAALHAVHQRHATRGSWTLYAAELSALDDMVWLHSTIQIPSCSYGELSDAMHRTRNRMQQALAGNAPRGALVIDGGMGSSEAGA